MQYIRAVSLACTFKRHIKAELFKLFIQLMALLLMFIQIGSQTVYYLAL